MNGFVTCKNTTTEYSWNFFKNSINTSSDLELAKEFF